jgi:hypothetical protein
MAQGTAGVNILSNNVSIKDGANLDAFSRLRVSSPTNVFDAQFTYGLQPLLFEQITSGSGATITHDTTNRNALMTFSSTPSGGQAIMQSYEYFRYQPLKSQLIAVTFNFLSSVANCLKFAGYSDGVNGIEFQNNGITNRMVVYSSTSEGNEIVNQADWNLDKLDGAGKSGITLDITKSQILIIDFQALYLGRVRVGFDIGGAIVYAHEFNHANLIVHPYIADANLPIRVGMTCTSTVSTTMNFQCSAIASEGGSEETVSYDLCQDFSVTAGSGTRTHALSLRPKLLFNGFTNRTKVGFIEIEMLVTGNSSVKWELCVGQAISGTTTFADVNATYSSMEFNTAGTLSGIPAIVTNRGYVGATNTAKGVISNKINSRYPITLDAAGLQRLLGTITFVVEGISAASACQGTLKWKEIR